MPPTGGSPDTAPPSLIVVIVLLYIFIIAAGVLFYQSQEQQAKDSVTTELSSIAMLKTDQIVAWREERLGDGLVLSQNPILIDGVKDYLASPDPANRQKILTLFSQINTSDQYRNVRLVDRERRVQISLEPSDTAISPWLDKQLAESFVTHKVTLTDLSAGIDGGSPQMYVIAPLFVSDSGINDVVGAFILTIEPTMDLNPLIQSWPVPSDSGEIQLVEREGDNVLFLNELRHQNNTPLNLTIPLSRTEIPAVRAVLGTTGPFTGVDYQGADVISVLEPIPGSPWFIVVKVDAEEVNTAWGDRSVLIIALVGVSLAGVHIIIRQIWQRRLKFYYRTLFRSQAERTQEEQRNRQRLETLLRLAEMESVSERELADYALDAGCRFTDSPVAFIGFMTPGESASDIMAWSKSVRDDCSVKAAPVHFPIEKAGIWAEAVRRRKPFIVNDYMSSRIGKKGLPPGHVPIARFASVPIFEGQQIVMVCGVANKETDYTAMDVGNLTLLMQVVWDHHRKRLMDQTLRQKKIDLEAAFEKITASEEAIRMNYEKLAGVQQALDENERKYRNLYQYAQVGLFETSLNDGIIVTCNQRFSDLFGFSSVEEAIEKDVLGLYVNPDERTEWNRILQEQGSIKDYVLKFRNLVTGQVFWGQLSARYNYERNVAEGSIIDVTAQKVAEVQLKETNEYLLSLFNYANTPIIVWDPEFRITRFNHAFEHMTGRTEQEVIGKHLSLLFPEASRDASLELIKETSAGERWEVVEIPIEHLSGEIRIVLWNSANVSGSEGTVIATIAQGMDITGRKEAEESLYETNEYLRNLLDYANAPIIVWDPEFRITRFNHAFERLTGRNEQEVIGKHLSLLFPEASRDASLELIKETSAGERWEVVEIPIEHISGEIRVVLWNSGNIVDPSGTIISIIAQGQDITERKVAEDELKKNEHKFQTLAEFTYDWVYWIDTNSNVIYTSPSCERITGYAPENFISNPDLLLTIVHPDDQEMYGRHRSEVHNKPSEGRLEFRIITRNGSILWLGHVCRPIFDSAGNILGTRVSNRDITDQKAMQNQREILIRELEQKNAELERFTYTVSHDLKSPLITIKGFAGLLEEDVQNGDPLLLKKDINHINEAADTMQMLLADLLELSRIGRIVNPPKKTDFGTIVHEAVDLLAIPLAERGVTVEIAPGLPDIYVDHVRIREVMVNLIENAIKFFVDQPDPVIRIGVDTTGEAPVFFVQDNGIGIDPRYLERIFNLFEKLDVSGQGTGIGLAIVRRIIEVHGGKIWAESEGPGKGTTFRFTLPVIQALGDGT